jgi:hypothetical protein
MNGDPAEYNGDAELELGVQENQEIGNATECNEVRELDQLEIAKGT